MDEAINITGLQNLGDIVQDTKRKLDGYDYSDITLSKSFRSVFKRVIEKSGNKVQFQKTTAIITNASDQKIYAPNQWFVIAAYAVPLAKEVMKYRGYTEKYIDKRLSDIKSIVPERIKEKKDVYQLLRSGDDIVEKLAEEIKKIFSGELQNDGCTESEANKNCCSSLEPSL